MSIPYSVTRQANNQIHHCGTLINPGLSAKLEREPRIIPPIFNVLSPNNLTYIFYPKENKQYILAFKSNILQDFRRFVGEDYKSSDWTILKDAKGKLSLLDGDSTKINQTNI